ncbi:MAG: hypothetical protein RLZZ500_750 [Bacteroidota bacterium]|jgi:hypothetical protein
MKPNIQKEFLHLTASKRKLGFGVYGKLVLYLQNFVFNKKTIVFLIPTCAY